MKFYIHTLGCKVNAYESNVMKENMIRNGYIEDINADIHIVNTCTVTNTADKKSLKVIRSIRNNNPNALIVVTGCLSQIDSSLIDADIIVGNIGKSNIAEYIKNYKSSIVDIKNINNADFEDMKLDNFDKTRAFIKIEDGCENFCAYCIIPYARGKVRCKDKNVIFEEVKSLIDNGHSEIVLTGIHTGHYNLDGYSFADLLNDLIKINKLSRIRISSIEITEITDEVLAVFKKSDILVDHIHIPLQSGSDAILKSMNRKYDKTYFIKRIEEIRKIRPNMSITTDVIVGFPGETEELFNETIGTIEKVNFSKIHVFPFSRRKNTLADEMDNQIDESIKKERVKILMNISKELEMKYFSKFINSKTIFIPEVYKDGFLIGHSGNYLMVKAKGSSNLLHKETSCIIRSINYPYCIGDVIDEKY